VKTLMNLKSRKTGTEGSVVTETARRIRQMACCSSTLNFTGKRFKGYSDEWYTPPRIVSALGPFDLDPCAGPMKHAAQNLRHPDECGLSVAWAGRVWLNPPYSNVHEWLAKFIGHGNGIALVNARPETKWFQHLAVTASGILWLRGRIKFQMPDGASKHPTVGSVLVAYGDSNAEALRVSGLPGVLTEVRAPAPSAS